MKNDILFSETQKFRQLWVWLLIVSVNILIGYGIVDQMASVNANIKNEFNPFLGIGLILIFDLFFFVLRLETQIKKDGIYVRFFPLHLKARYYSWELISESYTREYKPVQEYGGWGIKYNFTGKGKAYNVSGNKGLQIELKTGKKILIGTNKFEELSILMGNLKKN